MNKKYIVLFNYKWLFKEVLFKRLIDYYKIQSSYEVVLISKHKLNENVKQYSSLEELFKHTKGSYLIIEKCVFFESFDELNSLKENTKIYKNNLYIGKFLVNKKDYFLNHKYIGFLYIIYNDFSAYKLSKILQNKINKKLIKSGVNILDINTTYISVDSTINKDTTIYPSTYIISSKIGNNCSIGPFSTIKNNSIISSDCRVGNFVEIKNSFIGSNTKIAHHAYIGDSFIGSSVNIGCGVITCNYDGLNKHKIVIKDRSFIGSNVNLIAPVNIGSDTYIASGSTVYNDVADLDFVIARSYQVNKKGYSIKYPYYQKFFSENLSEE